MSGRTKLLATVLLFVVAVGLVALAVATERHYPLFAAWVPLVVVPWVLTRPEAPSSGPHGRSSGAGRH